MKYERNILIAFLLNVIFSIIEIFGGIVTNSVAILSDAVHDFGDAFSIGLSFFLEKKSGQKPDNLYTYGYIRYSVLSAFISSIVLLVGSGVVIYNSIIRLFNPVDINYEGMIVFAVLGIIMNFMAAYYTKDGASLNQKTVNLHMIEDFLGWIVVLFGAIIMKFTDIKVIDSVLSIGVSSYILIHVLKNLKNILDLFLEKTPLGISLDELKKHILSIKGIKNVHHIHVWSIDGINNYATMHIVSNEKNVKDKVRQELKEHGINHVTIEIENEHEKCAETTCEIKEKVSSNHHKH